MVILKFCEKRCARCATCRVCIFMLVMWKSFDVYGNGIEAQYNRATELKDGTPQKKRAASEKVTKSALDLLQFMSLSGIAITFVGMLYTVNEPTFLQEWTNLQQNQSVNTTISVTAAITAAVWLGLSLLFIHGIMKKNANYVIWYFLFSCYLCLQFCMMIVLQLIAQYWITAGATLFFTLIYMRCVVAVYKIYGIILNQSDDDRKQLFDYDFINESGIWSIEIWNEALGGPQANQEPQEIEEDEELELPPEMQDLQEFQLPQEIQEPQAVQDG